MENFKREIELEDKELFELAQKKEELVIKGRDVNKEAEDLAKQHEKKVEEIRKIAKQIDRLKQYKIIPRTVKLVKDKLEEYEIPVTTLIKDGKLILQIEDVLEEFKQRFKSVDKFEAITPTKKK